MQKEHQIPVCEMILKKIKNATEEIQLESDRTLLYHGLKFGIVGDIAL